MAGKRKYRTESQGLETVVKKNGFLSARRDAIQNRAYEMPRSGTAVEIIEYGF